MELGAKALLMKCGRAGLQCTVLLMRDRSVLPGRSADFPVPDQAEGNAGRQGQEKGGGTGEDDAVEAKGPAQEKEQRKIEQSLSLIHI